VTPPTDTPPEPPNGSDLCTECGLCCAGLFFDVAPLEEHEIALAGRLRLPLACNQHHDAFRLPCPCLEERRCAVYDKERPSVCASYECGLLRRFKAGEVPRDEALARVRRATARADELRRRVPAGAPPRPLWDDARAYIQQRDAEATAPGWQADKEDLVRSLAALRADCRRDIDP
jgi:Fe-S-cluster containining protein